MSREVKPFQALVGKVKQSGPDQWDVYLDDGAACDPLAGVLAWMPLPEPYCP